MEIVQRLINEIMDKMDPPLTGEDRKKYEEIMLKIFDKKMKPQEVLGFSEEMVEHMYFYGFRLYNNGQYKQACNVFQGLHALAPDETRFLLALAASYHRLKNYPQAVQFYYELAVKEPGDPLPFYYMYDCYYKTGYLSDAGISLAQVIDRCGDNPMYAKIKERSLLMFHNLEEQVKKLQKEGKLVVEDVKPPEDPLEKIVSINAASLEPDKK